MFSLDNSQCNSSHDEEASRTQCGIYVCRTEKAGVCRRRQVYDSSRVRSTRSFACIKAFRHRSGVISWPDCAGNRFIRSPSRCPPRTPTMVISLPVRNASEQTVSGAVPLHRWQALRPDSTVAKLSGLERSVVLLVYSGRPTSC